MSSVWILLKSVTIYRVRVRAISQDWASIYGAKALQGELQGRTCYIHFWLSFGQVWKTNLGESTGCAMCMCVCTWTGCLHMYVILYEHIWYRSIVLFIHYVCCWEVYFLTQLSNILTNHWLSPPLDMFFFFFYLFYLKNPDSSRYIFSIDAIHHHMMFSFSNFL